MRVTTAFKRLLRLLGPSVTDGGFGAEGVIVTVTCAAAGASAQALADRPAAGDSRPARQALAPAVRPRCRRRRRYCQTVHLVPDSRPR